MAKRGIRAYTDDLAKEVLAGIASGCTEEDATAAAGISTDTLLRWKKGQAGAPADFAERFNRAIPKRKRAWLNSLSELARNGDGPVRLKALTELLDRCAPDYRKVEKHEHSGPDGAPLSVIFERRT